MAERINISSSREGDVHAARAAGALREGRLVILPTETVYGVAASAQSSLGLDRLWKLKGTERRSPLAWHLHTSAAVLEVMAAMSIEASPLQRRLIRIFTPGAVTLAIGADPAGLAAVRARAGVGEDIFDDGAELLVRVPDRHGARAVIEQAGVPVVAASIGARTADESVQAVESSGSAGDVEAIIDGGPTIFRVQSTLLRLSQGGFQVARVGAIDERTIHKRMARTILFVCTGNTCRSPMAAAIARHLLQNSPSGIETTVKSAGVTAGFGMEATPEGVLALQDLGIEMGRHTSTPVTRELLNSAEVVFAMAQSHVDALHRLDPTASGRVVLLDPTGADIADPIGGPREQYNETARALLRSVGEQLHRLAD